MVAIADGRGCIAFCSAGAGVLLGWTSQEMVGQPASSGFTSAISEALTPDAGEWLSEMVLRTRDGRPVPATVRVAQRSENAHLPGSPTRTEPRLSTSRQTAPDGRSPKAFSIPALNPTCHPSSDRDLLDLAASSNAPGPTRRSLTLVTIDTKPRERALISHASSKASSKRSYAGFGRRAASHGRESAVRGG
ncbi:PAS domain-containing protein [Streptomyces bauhiniae]|uniref:PAS domain-containing protein n=1 Tax=Streptomyces bauhiniae TaxID=2340725 RepID=UPI003654FEB8